MKAQDRAGLWKRKVGGYGCSVTAQERTRGGKITLYWTSKITGKQKTHTLENRVRDRYGRMLSSEEKEVLAIAEAYSAAIQRGEDPAPEKSPPKLHPLSLEEGGHRFFQLGTGAFRIANPHYMQRKRDFDYLLIILGAAFVLSNLLPATAEIVWRWFLDRSENGENHRTAARVVDTLYHMARWLHGRFPREMPDVRPLSKWQTRMAEEWEDAFSDLGHAPNRPRHSPEEAEQIFRHLHRTDPRLALLLEIGAELRGGQVARTRRSHVDRTPGLGRWGMGRIAVEGRKKKRGEIVDIHPELDAMLESAWGPKGHLQELEAAYERGEIPDYYLFQHGKMRQKKGDPDVKLIPLERHRSNPGSMDISTLIPIFHRYEIEIGIEPVKGRAFYGLRRVLTDIAPSYTSDDRHLDRLTGHSAEGSTRVAVYQDRERDEDIAGAAEVRRQIRRDARTGTIRTTPRPAHGPSRITRHDLAHALRAMPAKEREELLRTLSADASDDTNAPDPHPES